MIFGILIALENIVMYLFKFGSFPSKESIQDLYSKVIKNKHHYFSNTMSEKAIVDATSHSNEVIVLTTNHGSSIVYGVSMGNVVFPKMYIHIVE